MDREGFLRWLIMQGASEKTARSDVSRMNRLERALPEYGFPYRDLDAAFQQDLMEGVLKAIEKSLHDLPGTRPPVALVPNSTDYVERLTTALRCARKYRGYKNEMGLQETDADRIRQHVLQNYINPARREGREHDALIVKTINEALGLNQAWPNICQSLSGRKFLSLAHVPPPERFGRNQSTATRYRFDLRIEDYWARRILIERLGQPVHETKKLMIFEAADGQNIVLDLEASTTQIWVEGERAVADMEDVVSEIYPADRTRHSNLPPRLKQPNVVTRVTLVNSDDLIAFLDASLAPHTVQFTVEDATMPSPTNLILYGPPGTGKTYITAREAVRLCGEVVPEDRDQLMALYRSLQQRGRIGFVTFHQNFSYEDFVEGLRPTTGGNDGDGSSGGFELEPQDGIFKQMADIAASNHGKAITQTPVIERSSKVFKMSLGRSREAEDDIIYQDAIREGYVTLGWGGDIDWSDPRYDEWAAIKERWRQDHPEASGNDPNMSQMYTFRINMEVGSLVVISDGNRKFRAIGEVTGPYEFRPGHNGGHNHYRSVRWLWNGESLPRERIYSKELSQVSAYQMNGRNLNWDGLEQTVASGGDAVTTSGEPEPHVLIIDEINRANISKVFGELITLLEPDKRLSMPNALTVRLPYSKTEFGVPANLHLIGTMNTADRSIALLDTALRRRFAFRELAPRSDLLSTIEGIPLPAVLTTINERIEYLVDREHRIGHAFFIHCATRADIDAVMRDKIIPLLQEYFFEDWSRIHAVLGEGFIGQRLIQPPPGMEGMEPRQSWFVRNVFAQEAYDRLMGNPPKAAADGDYMEIVGELDAP